VRQCANRAPIVRQCFFALAHGACANAPMLAGGMGESARAHLPPRGCRANQPRANAPTGYRLLPAARCTASTMNAGFRKAPPMKPPPMPLGRTARHLQATFWRRTWVGSQTTPRRL